MSWLKVDRAVTGRGMAVRTSWHYSTLCRVAIVNCDKKIICGSHMRHPLLYICLHSQRLSHIIPTCVAVDCKCHGCGCLIHFIWMEIKTLRCRSCVWSPSRTFHFMYLLVISLVQIYSSSVLCLYYILYLFLTIILFFCTI